MNGSYINIEDEISESKKITVFFTSVWPNQPEKRSARISTKYLEIGLPDSLSNRFPLHH